MHHLILSGPPAPPGAEALLGPSGAEALLGPLGALGSSLTWALGSSVYARWARTVGAVEVNLSRALIVWPLFLVGALATLGPNLFHGFSPARVGWLSASTLCSYGVGDLLFYLAALRLGTATALAIASIYPVWAAILGAVTLGEQLTLGRLGGTALCVLGVIWLVLLARDRDGATDSAGRGDSGRGDHVLGGVALALLTSLLWAGNTYTIRRGAGGVPMLAANALRFGLALGGLWLWRTLGELRRGELRRGVARAPRLLRQPGALVFAAAAVVEGFGGSSMFVYGLSHTDLAVAAPLSSLAPLFAVPVGMLLGGERVGLRRIVAIAMTVAGIVLLVR